MGIQPPTPAEAAKLGGEGDTPAAQSNVQCLIDFSFHLSLRQKFGKASLHKAA